MDLTKFGVDKKEPNSDSRLDFSVDEMKENLTREEKETYLPWFMKYQLSSFDQLIETKELKKIKAFFEKPNLEKGLLLVGPPGSGKTSTLTLFGNQYNYEIVEMNASDMRNKKAIAEQLGEAVSQKSLFNQEKLLLIDEADGISGTFDRGGASELSKILKKSSYPFVLTANDKEATSLKALKKLATVVDFEQHSKQLLNTLAEHILTNEDITYSKKDLDTFISLRETTDIRGFINDLQASVIDKKLIIDSELELRDYKKKIESLLTTIFYSYPEESLNLLYNSDVQIDDLLLYLEENVPAVYSLKGQYNAFNEISKADVFRGRIRKWQYWRYLVYMSFYLTYGVSSAKTNPKKSTFKRNSRILKKWIYGNKYGVFQSRTKTQKRKDEPEKSIELLAKQLSTSVVKCRSQDLLYIALIVKNQPAFASYLQEEFNFDTKAIELMEDLV